MKIGFVSDIHEDIVSLRQAVRLMESRGVDQIVCLGDIVGYSVPYYGYMPERDANAVVDLIRVECGATVCGNHDLFAVRKVPDHQEFFRYPADWYDLDFHEREVAGRGQLHLYERNELPTLLNRRNRDFLFELPESHVLEVDGQRLLLTHYAAPDITGSGTWEARRVGDADAHFEKMTALGCSLGVSGNDHWPGYHLFTHEGVTTIGLGQSAPMTGTAWLHGPAVARGTTPNGFMIYDTGSKQLDAVALGGPIHTPATSF